MPKRGRSRFLVSLAGLSWVCTNKVIHASNDLHRTRDTQANEGQTRETKRPAVFCFRERQRLIDKDEMRPEKVHHGCPTPSDPSNTTMNNRLQLLRTLGQCKRIEFVKSSTRKPSSEMHDGCQRKKVSGLESGQFLFASASLNERRKRLP